MFSDHLYERKKTFTTSCLLSGNMKLFHGGPTVKGENLLPEVQILSFQYKFINLLITTNFKDLNNLSKNLINAFKLRENPVITS